MTTHASNAKTNVQRAYEFVADLEAKKVLLRERVTEAYMHIILLAFMNIVVGGNYSPGTPVDTGFARNSWVVGLNGIAPFRQSSEPSQSVQKGNEPIALVSMDDGQATLIGVQLGDVVHITSNAAYMGALEDGHSDQAPTGFIWLVINAAPQIVDVVVREMLS